MLPMLDLTYRTVNRADTSLIPRWRASDTRGMQT